MGSLELELRCALQGVPGSPLRVKLLSASRRECTQDQVGTNGGWRAAGESPAVPTSRRGTFLRPSTHSLLNSRVADCRYPWHLLPHSRFRFHLSPRLDSRQLPRHLHAPLPCSPSRTLLKPRRLCPVVSPPPSHRGSPASLRRRRSFDPRPPRRQSDRSLALLGCGTTQRPQFWSRRRGDCFEELGNGLREWHVAGRGECVRQRIKLGWRRVEAREFWSPGKSDHVDPVADN